jgi:hypothetical protein
MISREIDHPHPTLPRQWGGLLAELRRLLDGLFMGINPAPTTKARISINMCVAKL